MVRWRVVCGYRTHEQAESAGRDGAGVSSFASKFCTRDESAWHESTRDPIFVLLVDQAQLLDYDEDDRPDGWYRDDEGTLRIRAGEENDPENDERPTFDEIVACRDNELPITIETRVESVWLTRQEADAWLDSHRYRFRACDQVRARVYCVCAEGELASLLKDGTEGSAKSYPRRARGGAS